MTDEAGARTRGILHELGSHLRFGVVICSPDGTMLFANRPASQLLGLPDGDALRKVHAGEPLPFVREDGTPLPADEHPVQRAISTLRPVEEHLLALRRSPADDPISVLVGCHPDLDEQGRLGQVVVTLVTVAQMELTSFEPLNTEIAERKRAEELLLKSREEMRLIFKLAHIPMGSFNQEGIVTNINDRFTQLFGYTAEDVPTLSEWWALAYPDERYRSWVIKTWDAAVEKATREGKVIDPTTFNVTCKDGTVLNVEISGITIGESFLASFMDLTARKQAEEEREALRAQLNQAQRIESLGRLAGGVAHDFNNVLGAILGNAELALLSMSPSDRLYGYLKEIEKAAERSANLTAQLLAFARTQTVTPSVLDLNENVGKVHGMLSRLIGENVTLSWEPTAGLWPIKIDPSQVDQILTNLCVNARDAIGGAKGRVEIRTENCVVDDASCAGNAERFPGEFVAIVVSDSGCGMDEDIQAKIFDPFFTTKGVGQGTGLGLSTVYGIVKQNNGFIDVSSEPGRGTTFRIHLPRHAGTVEGKRARKETASTDGAHETVLLVEDDRAVLSAVQGMLKTYGYRVLAASTPGEALRLAESHESEIHLLLTDVIMPEITGRELAQALLAVRPNIRTLFMSGFTADIIGRHGIVDERVFFIAKPFTARALASKLRETLAHDPWTPGEPR